jgi:hypothetical protein
MFFLKKRYEVTHRRTANIKPPILEAPPKTKMSNAFTRAAIAAFRSVLLAISWVAGRLIIPLSVGIFIKANNLFSCEGVSFEGDSEGARAGAASGVGVASFKGVFST